MQFCSQLRGHRPARWRRYVEQEQVQGRFRIPKLECAGLVMLNKYLYLGQIKNSSHVRTLLQSMRAKFLQICFFIRALLANTWHVAKGTRYFVEKNNKISESIECSNLTLTNASTFVWKYFRVKNTWLSPPQISPDLTPKIFVKKNKDFREITLQQVLENWISPKNNSFDPGLG